MNFVTNYSYKEGDTKIVVQFLNNLTLIGKISEKTQGIIQFEQNKLYILPTEIGIALFLQGYCFYVERISA